MMAWTDPPTEAQKAEVIRAAGVHIVPAWGARQIRRMLTAVEMMPESKGDASAMITWLNEQAIAPFSPSEAEPNTCFESNWSRMPIYWFEMLADAGYHHPTECKCTDCARKREMDARVAERIAERAAERDAREKERTARRTEMIMRARGDYVTELGGYMPRYVTEGTFFIYPDPDSITDFPGHHEVNTYDPLRCLRAPQKGDLIKVMAARSGKLYGRMLTTIEQKKPGTGEIEYKGRYEGIGTIYLTYLDERGKLTPKRAAQLGHAFGFCVYCTKVLDDPESKLNGMGRSCWNQHCRSEGTPWKKMDGGVIK